MVKSESMNTEYSTRETKIRVAFCVSDISRQRNAFFLRFQQSVKMRFIALYGDLEAARNKYPGRFGETGGYPKRCLRVWRLSTKVEENPQDVYLFPALLWYLWRYRPQVIVLEGEHSVLNNLMVFLYARIKRAKIMWWSAGRGKPRPTTIRNMIFDSMVRHQILGSNFIAGQNSPACDYYRHRYSIPSYRMVLAPSTTDDIAIREMIEKVRQEGNTDESRDAEHPIILYAGAMETTSRVEAVIDSMRHIWKTIPGARLLLIGDGELRSQFERRAKEPEMKGRITVAEKDLEEATASYLQADVAVLPSPDHSEILTALAHGVPIVSGVADGTEQDVVVDGKTGYIIYNTKPEKIAETVLKIVGDTRLAKSMRDNCVEKVERYWNIMIQADQIRIAIMKTLEAEETIGKYLKRNRRKGGEEWA